MHSSLEVRCAFGLLFIGVAISVGLASILSEIAFEQKDSYYYYFIIWAASFAITFGSIFARWKNIIPSIRDRMKNSIKWSTPVKIINGLCWAAPFAAISAFPFAYQYLILLGIGLGNTSTYVFMKKFSRIVNNEQLIVGGISLFAIPVAVAIDFSYISNQIIAIIISRLMIALAYGVGGIFAILSKK